MKTRSKISRHRASKNDEKDDTESSDSSTGSLNETDIQLLNAAGISVLSDISHEEKLEILKAISESKHPRKNIPSNEEGLFAPSCSKDKDLSDTESRSIQQVSQLKGEDSLNNARTASSNQITNTSLKLEQKQNSKTNIEEGGKDQTNLEDLTSSFVGIKDGKANSDLLESESSCSCKDSIRTNSHSDVVISDESSKTLSPLFKGKVHKKRQPCNPCLNTKPCKFTSIWSFIHLSNNGISPDQYTEVVKLIYDIYFQRLRREQIEIKEVVNKWGKPVLPGPHVDGCLLSKSKTRKFYFNANSDSSEEEDITRNVKSLPKCQELFDDSGNVEEKLFHCTEEDKETDNIGSLTDPVEIDLVGNKKQADQSDHSFISQYAVEEKPRRNLRLSKRKFLLTGSEINKSSKKRLVGKKDTFCDHSLPLTVSREVMSNKKSEQVNDKERSNIYIWSNDDSSNEFDSASNNRSLVFKDINDEMKIDDKEEDLTKNNSSKTDISEKTDDEIVSETTEEINVDEISNLLCKKGTADSQECMELPDIELSQETCMSNSQSSNSMLDINGYIYSTQIIGHKIKILDSATGEKASEKLHENCKGYNRMKKLKGNVNKIIFENTTEKHCVNPEIVCKEADQPSFLKDNNVDTNCETAKKKIEESSDLSHKNRQKLDTVTLRRRKKNTKSQLDDNMSNNSLIEIPGDCSGAALMEPEILGHLQNVCPICGKNFKQEDIEEHASACGEEYKDPNLKRCNFCNCEMTADILDEHETKCSIRNKIRSVPSRLTRSLKAGTSPLQKAPEPLLVSDSEDDGELIIEVESGTQKRIM